ncbi:hypothetical protein BpHYR1_004417 [Brachionus plicatilis]|uniref:UPAR/Ly6 domain-containing protein n=1 Tax=Brachionus plicatilis TaxID=10195 RepID=A0A3M7T3T7_BRAPC|nr:hypothetical protein BpHYR1_004417 [Brachionus plicatilis]
MKSFLELLFLTVIIQGFLLYQTNSLKCYDCLSCPSSNEGSLVTCPDDSNSFCMNAILSNGDKQSFTKRCSSNCTERNNGFGLEIKCCSTDGCNKQSTTPTPTNSLQCYECDSCDESNQGSLVTCPNDSNSFCMNDILSYADKQSFTKRCSSDCTESKTETGFQTTCCSTDGCNKHSTTPTPTKSLQCYECDSCDESNQGSLVTCPTGSNSYCGKTIVSAGSIQSITKKCLNICTELNTGSGLQTTCCSTDGCNKHLTTPTPTKSLQCYECDSCDESNQGSLITCPTGSNIYCMNYILSSGGKKSITKRCSSICSESNNEYGLEVECCSTDGCNKHLKSPATTTNNSLKCYECDSCTGTNQGALVTCPSESNSFCMSTIYSTLGIKIVTKKCSSSCIQANTGTILGTGFQTKCCSIDGCNKSNISLQLKSEYLI